MANLTTLLYPVSASITNVPRVSASITNSFLVSAITPGGALYRSNRVFSDGIEIGNKTLYEIYGFNYNLEDLYLLIYKNPYNYGEGQQLLTLLIKACSPFNFSFPSGIEGSYLVIYVSNSAMFFSPDNNQNSFNIALTYKTNK